MKLRVLSLSALACLLFLAEIAGATPTQLVLGTSTTGDLELSNVAGVDDMSFTGCGGNCLEGFGYFGATVGNYDVTISGTPTLGSPTGGVYPINMNGAVIDFSWLSTDHSLWLDGSITLNNVTDGTQTPRFIGGLLVSSTDLPGYQDGTYAGLDFLVNLGSNPSIDYVYNHPGSSTEGYLSSGEIPPGSAPEPGSIVLLGSGVVGLAGLLRRKLTL
jgi:hypothetical protein